MGSTNEGKNGEHASLRALVDAAEDALILLDERFTIVFINRAALRMFGYAEDEAIGKPISLVLPGFRERRRSSSREELQACCKDASDLTVECAIKRVRVGEEVFFAANIRNITRRKEIEDRLKEIEGQMRQSQKMVPLGRLAGGIAHDFNNLLTAMRYHASFALENLPEGSAARKEILDLDAAASRAADLTGQLLAFGRRQVLAPRVLEVNEVVDQMSSMLTRMAGDRIELVTDLHDDAGKIKADPGQLERVITNLVVNAVDAIDGDGQVRLSTRPVADASAGEDFVVLSVEDTGSGMTDDVSAKIFDPFFTTKETGKGTGLGLSTVYGIVRQSEGDIDVESTPGEGSTFKVRLPRVEGSAWKIRPTDRPPPRIESPRGDLRGSETVLLVEDDSMVRRAAARILRSRGYTVTAARDGDAAMRIALEGTAFDLLLSDVNMPGMNGPELARRLRARDGRLTVLLMSGYTGSDFEEVAPWPLLPKPFTPQALAQMVRAVLDNPEG